MSTTHVTRRLAAPRATVYRALISPEAIAEWKFPDGMRCEIEEFEGREFRVSLTYEGRGVGKTSGRTDTYRGRFERLVPDEQVVEVDEFETDDPSLQGEMTVTITLRDAGGGGTELDAVHANLPPGLDADDNERGWSSALDRLAALVESR